MNNFLNKQYSIRQIIGFLLIIGSGGYLFFALMMYAIGSSTYM